MATSFSLIFVVQTWQWYQSPYQTLNKRACKRFSKCRTIPQSHLSMQLAVCAVHANKSGALPGVKPNMSHCETSHILRVKGETFLQAMQANRTVQPDSSYSCNISPPKQQKVVAAQCKKLWSTAQKERNHKTGSASALLIPPPFTFHPSPSPEFQMGMNVFLPAFHKAAY